MRVDGEYFVLRDPEEIMLHKKIIHARNRLARLKTEEGKDNMQKKLEWLENKLHQLRVKHFCEGKPYVFNEG